MTFGAGIMWVYLLLPIVGAFVMLALQWAILKRLKKLEDRMDYKGVTDA